MKYALSALAGSLVSTIAVVLAGHTPALLVLLGAATAVFLYTWILRIIPASLVLRFLRVSVVGKTTKPTAEPRGPFYRGVGPGPTADARPNRGAVMRDDQTPGVCQAPRLAGERAGLRSKPVRNDARQLVTLDNSPVRARAKYNRAIVLKPVQQDVLSALMNLGCSFSQAETAVQSVSDRQGESFDALFRKAVEFVKGGRRAVA